MESNEIFKNLFNVLELRKKSSPEESYVASLFQKGLPKINLKIIEEANEVLDASGEEDKAHLIYEICDLLFHTFVLASYKDIKLEDIEKELDRRFGKSGLQEKKERGKKKQ